MSIEYLGSQPDEIFYSTIFLGIMGILIILCIIILFKMTKIKEGDIDLNAKI